MSKLILIGTSVLLFFSCGENSSVVSSDDKDDHENDNLVETETDLILEDKLEIVEPIEMKLEDFPKKWIQLSCDEYGEGCVIYHYCEAELPQILIEPQYGDQWTLTALYGQDSDTWIIREFEATEREMELMSVVEGTMILVKETNESATTNVTFMWNKDEAFCNFTGIFQGEQNYFVNEEERDSYEEVAEDCSGLWE